MKQPPFRLFLFIVATLLAGPPLVWGLGSVLYENPSTMRSFPKKTEAGYIATADGGVVSLMNAPAPTAVGQAVRITSIGTGTNQSAAGFVDDPVATTTGKGVVQIDTSARLSATTVTTTASATSTKVQAAGAMCILPKATTSVWGVSEFDGNLPLADGVPSVGNGGLALQSNHKHPTEGVARIVYYLTGSGGVSPTVLSPSPNGSSDTFTSGSLNSSGYTDIADVWGSGPGLTVLPGGTYKLRLWAYATGNSVKTYAYWLYNGVTIGGTSTNYATVAVGTTLVEYDEYVTLADSARTAGQLELRITAGTTTGTGTLTVGIGGAASTSFIPPWAPPPIALLASSAPPLVAAGPSTAGTATSARRSDDVVGLSASNPNKGDFYRSPVGTDTATNTSAGWDHATDIPRYAGSGTADPTTGAGVPCLLAAASPNTMCFYYQTLHCNDGGCTYAIWWKSGSADTAWTQFGTGGSGGSQAVELTSPDGSINIGQGGGMTTAETNLGSLTTNRLTKALTGYTNRLAPSLISDDGTTVGNHAGAGAVSYFNTNLDNLSSTTAMNPGITFFNSEGNLYGLDLGYTSFYAVRMFAPVGRTLEFGAMASSPTSQADFTRKMYLDTTTGSLVIVGNVSAANITPTPAANMIVESDAYGTVCQWVETCGYQAALPACNEGQELVNGTDTGTATGTNTTTVWTCRTSPWQPAGSYEPAQSGKPGQIEMFGTTTATGTATTTTTVKTAQNPPWTTSSGIGVSTVHNITTATGSATTTAIATAAIGDNAQVTIPPASTTAYGVAELGTNNTVGTTTNTGTASTTATDGKCMPAGATANGDHKTLAGSGAPNPDYLVNLLYSGDGSISINGYYPDLSHEVVNLLARAGTTAVKGIVQMDPNARIAAASGTASSTSTLVLAADAKAARTTSADIATKTTTATASSTATDLMPSDAKVTLPVASTSGQGIVQMATIARIAAASGTASSTSTLVLAADAKAARATSRNIATTTATATASSTATDLLGSDAQVVLPVASTTQAGIVPISTTARIGNTTVTTTASSTATKCLGDDVTVIIPAAGVTGSGALLAVTEWSGGTSGAVITLSAHTALVHASGRAGGGQGGGCSCSGIEASYICAAPGGAQGEGIDLWLSVSGGSTCTVTVGLGGTGGAVTGATGGDTYFACPTGSTPNDFAGGLGGVGSCPPIGQPFATLDLPGASASCGDPICGIPGGGSHYTFNYLSDYALTIASALSGNGGGPGGGVGINVTGNGSLAKGVQGAGGGGAASILIGADTRTGGNGAPGFLRFEEYSSLPAL